MGDVGVCRRVGTVGLVSLLFMGVKAHFMSENCRSPVTNRNAVKQSSLK